MARKFPNWLKAYESYARDNYCPAAFHRWTGLTVLAAALERKVWCVNGKIIFYPNIFTMLVTYAGVGKSTALDRGTDLLERIKEEFNPNIKLIAEQITEPGLVKDMEERQEIMLSETKHLFHSSGFFFASEASASALQNTHGTFTATITRFYDCPRVFRKVTKGEHEKPTEIYNVCFSMLAGATFDYLKTLVNESSVMGGFASRIIYVISKDREIRTPSWGDSAIDDTATQQALFEDLCEIHKLQGGFTATREFREAWVKFQPESDRRLIAMNSPRLESLAARISTNTMKVAMLLCVAESNDMILEARHWDEAMQLIEDVSKNYSFILSQGAMGDKMSQTGVTQAIGQTLKRNGGKLPMNILKSIVLANGNRVEEITKTMDFMYGAGWLKLDSMTGLVELLVDPDRYL